jgi:Ca2+-binding RTX toxin-like protein
VTGTFVSLADGASPAGWTSGFISYFGGDGNDVTVTQAYSSTPVIQGTAGDDTFTVGRVANTLRVFLNGAMVFTAPVAALNGVGVAIEGLVGGDTLVFDQSASPAVAVRFEGGSGSDAVLVSGGTASTVAYTPAAPTAVAGPNSGQLSIDGTMLTFTGAEQVSTTTVATALTASMADLAAGDTAVFMDHGAANDRTSRLDFSSTGITDWVFTNPTGSLSLIGSSYADILRLEGLDGLDGSGVALGASVTVQAGAGDDTIALTTRTGSGAYAVHGESGGADELRGPALTQTWSLTGANTGSIGGAGAASFTGIESLVGGASDDTFLLASGLAAFLGSVSGGAGGTDTLAATNGANTFAVTSTNAGVLNGLTLFTAIARLVGGSGADTFRLDSSGSIARIDGGAGSDTLDYSNRGTAVSVDLEIGAATDVNGGASGGLVATSGIDNSIEQVRGGSGGDTLYGDPDTNTLIGNGGADTLNGRGGVDSLDAGAGNDILRIQGSEAANDTLDGGPGAKGDATDNDTLLNIGATDVLFADVDGMFNSPDLSLDLFDGNGQGLQAYEFADPNNPQPFSFTRLVNTRYELPTFVDGTAGGDVVVTNQDGVNLTIYDGKEGTDTITVVLTVANLGALLDADIRALQAYLSNPTGRELSLGAGRGRLRAVNFEIARLAVADDGQTVDITGIMPFIGSRANILAGTGGNDTLVGTGGADLILGGAGDDRLFGGNGNDWIFGGAGADSLWGEMGNDYLLGGTEADWLDGGLLDDGLDGGAGDDSVFGSDGYDQILIRDDQAIGDVIQGGPNTDLLVNIGTGPMIFANFNAVASSIEHLAGGNYPIFGRDEATLPDFLDFSGLIMSGVPYIDGRAGNDTLIGTGRADEIRGGGGDDLIRGLGGIDTLRGGAGNDSIDGGLDTDYLFGDEGADWLTGGRGRDWYVFSGDANSQDTVSDFELYVDYLLYRGYGNAYSNLVFTAQASGMRISMRNSSKQVLLAGFSRAVSSNQVVFQP